MTKRFLILFLIGLIGFQTGEVRGTGVRRLVKRVSELLTPTDEEVIKHNEFKPISEEDVQYLEGLYHKLISGAYAPDKIIKKKEKNPQNFFSSKLKAIINKILGNDLTDEEIRKHHEFKPPSEEDVLFWKELYNAIVNGDGTYLDEIVNEKEEKRESFFSSKLKAIISKILGNDKTDEEIAAHHEFKDPLTRDALVQLTALYVFVSDGVIVPDRLDLWTLPYGILEPTLPEKSDQDEPSTYESARESLASGSPRESSPSGTPRESSPPGSPKKSSHSGSPLPGSPRVSPPPGSPRKSSNSGSPEKSSPSGSSMQSPPPGSPKKSPPPKKPSSTVNNKKRSSKKSKQPVT